MLIWADKNKKGMYVRSFNFIRQLDYNATEGY